MSAAADGNAAAVVYVHGLWMIGAEAWWLRRRLWHERKMRLAVFRYRSVRSSMADILTALHRFIGAIEAPRVHLLGHSLGGLVILRYLQRFELHRPGRVVFLGTPVNGSRVARALARSRLGRRALGGVACEALLGKWQWPWDIPRELGIIAGTLPFGVGRLWSSFDEDNDGTVALSETKLPGAKSSLALRVSHSGLLLSPRVARETGSFLEHGCFGH